jgi:uracil DNA glycosylase
VTLTCTTANSNPPAEIKWAVAGRNVRNATSRTVVSPEGGWITTSNITVAIAPNKRSLVVICHGINMQLTENIVSTHTINILCTCHFSHLFMEELLMNASSLKSDMAALSLKQHCYVAVSNP